MCGSSLLHFPSYCWRFSRPCKLWHQVSDIHPTCKLKKSYTERYIENLQDLFKNCIHILPSLLGLLFLLCMFRLVFVVSFTALCLLTSLQPKVEINPFFKRKICYTTLHFQYPFSYISAYNDKGSPHQIHRKFAHMPIIFFAMGITPNMGGYSFLKDPQRGINPILKGNKI